MKTPNSEFYKSSLQKAVILSITTTVAIVVAFLSIDCLAGKAEIVSGYVVEKQYESEVTPSLGRQIQQPKDIKQADPNYVLMINNAYGEMLSITVDQNFYYSAELGQEVKYFSQRGFITGWYWNKELI